MGKDLKYIGFPAGTHKKYLDRVCYELDNDTDTLTITYTGKIYDFFLKSKTPYLIDRYGDKKIQAVEIISFFLSLLLYAALILYFFFLNRIEYAKQMFWPFIITDIGLIIFFFATSEQFSKIKDFHKNSLCKKCGRYFAYEEHNEPIIKEVSSRLKYEITITRYWECKFCGNKDPRIEGLNYYQQNGEREDRKNRTCRECNKEYALIEYKLPDIKIENDTATTIRHYECTSCGYHEITIKMKNLPD
ncbi:MAG: hypothetical protein PHV51_04415 [Methanosarcinaceae archaeon]|nr:hypothetical protein [Methanosarcinaceae archaeon]